MKTIAMALCVPVLLLACKKPPADGGPQPSRPTLADAGASVGRAPKIDVLIPDVVTARGVVVNVPALDAALTATVSEAGMNASGGDTSVGDAPEPTVADDAAVQAKTEVVYAEPGGSAEDSLPSGGPVANGFAAVSADGTTLLATIPGVGPLSAHQLAIVFLNATSGATRQRIEVVSRTQSEAMDLEIPKELEPTLRQQVVDANIAVQALHPHPLPAFIEANETTNDTEDTVRTYEASREGWTLNSDGQALIVRHGDASTPVVLRRPFPPMPGADRTCRGVNHGKLVGFHVVNDHTLLVQTGYTGNDTCWEGTTSWIVVSIPSHP